MVELVVLLTLFVTPPQELAARALTARLAVHVTAQCVPLRRAASRSWIGTPPPLKGYGQW